MWFVKEFRVLWVDINNHRMGTNQRNRRAQLR